MKRVNRMRTAFVTFIVRMTPRCADMTRLISQSLDVRLPWMTRLRMRLHYGICVWCMRYQQQVRFIHDHAHEFEERLAADSKAPALTSEARGRMRQALRAGG